MKIKLAILAGLVLIGGVTANIVNGFKNSPTGQVVEQLQQRKQLIEQVTKSPTLTIPVSK